jgi:NADPH:quinone reductase-like Zn-dependent oxidoreductase
MPCYYNLLR